MNIVFMGTPDFSVPTLRKLNTDPDINISYVVTKADAKSSRGQKVSMSAIKEVALDMKLPILQPIKIKDDRETLDKIKAEKPDFIVVVAYGQILSKEILDIPKYACINGHASLLPKYRGASPIQSAILKGDKTTGTTTMLMGEGLDTGDILEQKEIEIDKKETADSLFDKLSEITAELMLHTLKNYECIKSVKQDDSKATKSEIIKKENGLIDFDNETAIDIERKIRAYTSWPSAYIKDSDTQIKIWDADVCEAIDLKDAKMLACGLYVLKDEIFAKCKDGFLKINGLQKSGKNRVKAKDFVNGLK